MDSVDDYTTAASLRGLQRPTYCSHYVPVPICRVYFSNTERDCGRTQLKNEFASSPSLNTTNKPVPAVFSQPKRAFAVHTRA